MTQGHPADHYIASFQRQLRFVPLGTGYFSTVSRILQETNLPLYASKCKQVIGLEIFAFVTNFQLLFPVKLR